MKSSPQPRLALVALAAMLLATLLAGCSAGQSVSGPDVVRKMRDTMRSATTVQGTVDLALTINKEGLKTLTAGMVPQGATSDRAADYDWTAKLPDTASITLNMWAEAPAKGRVEIDNSSLPGVKGVNVGSDGSKAYAYLPTESTLYTASRDALQKALAQAEERVDSMAGSLGLGFLQDFKDHDAAFEKFLDAADVKMLGTEKLDGREAYKLELTPKADAADRLGFTGPLRLQAGMLLKDARATVWVDTARSVPLKVVLEHPNMGSLTYTGNIELNSPVSPDKLVLQVPPGVKTVDLDSHLDKLESMGPDPSTLAEARDGAARAGWQLLEPAYLPEGAALVGVERIKTGESASAQPGGVMEARQELFAYTLKYSSPQADFTVQESAGTPEPALGDAYSGRDSVTASGMTTVTLRGVSARLFSPEGSGWTALTWQEKSDGPWIVIRGKLSADEAVKVAEGLK